MKSAAEIKFHLGKVWKLKNDPVQAINSFREALKSDPDFVDARIALADSLLDMGEISESLVQYDKALELDPDHPKLAFRRRYLKTLIDKKSATSERNVVEEYIDNEGGKIRLNRQKFFSCHRGGWNAGIDYLKSLHHRNGVFFDTFIEDNFAWKHWQEGIREPNVLKRLMHEGGFEALATSEEKGITPYTRPWIGVIHNPHNMPSWFHYQESPQSIMAKDIWQKSLEHCLGLFSLTNYQVDWLRKQVDCPVSKLVHPAEIPDRQFDFGQFERNTAKKIVQVGWWLRKLNSIYLLPIDEDNVLGYQKVRLVPRFFDDADRYLRELIEKETENQQLVLESKYVENTVEVQHLSNDEYDDLLCENIVFIQLYDAGANNTVVECIARSTPLLVNKLPGVLEYLGHEYPFYYDSLEEAAEKAMNLDLILETHNYLKQCSMREKLSFDYFKNSILESEVYRSLPLPNSVL